MNKIIPIIGNQYIDIVCDYIDSAQFSVKIIMYDWRWYNSTYKSKFQNVNYALVEARKRGVIVSVVTPQLATRRKLIANKINARGYPFKKLVHSKLIIIDDKHIIIGSHNFSDSAMSKNIESSVLIVDCNVADIYTKFFNTMFSYGCS